MRHSLSPCQPGCFPAARLRSCPAPWQPQSVWPPSVSASWSWGPGLRECRAAPLPQPASCLGAPSSWGPARCPALAVGQLSCLGRQAGALAPGLPSSCSRALQPSLPDGQTEGRLHAWPPPQAIWEAGILGRIFRFQKKVYVGKLTCGEREDEFSGCCWSCWLSGVQEVSLWRAGSVSLSEFSGSTLELARESKAVPRLHHHSLAHFKCREAL